MPHITAPTASTKRHLFKYVDGSQSYVTIGGRAPAWKSADRPALDVVMAALGGSMHARLPMLVRETLGEVYNIQSSAECYVEAGIFRTMTDCTPRNLENVIKQIGEGYAHLKTHPLTTDEIELAQHVLIGELVVLSEELSSRAEFYVSRLLLHNAFMTPADAQAHWKRVRRSDVERVVSRWIHPHKLAIACLGPIRKQQLSRLLPH